MGHIIPPKQEPISSLDDIFSRIKRLSRRIEYRKEKKNSKVKKEFR